MKIMICEMLFLVSFFALIAGIGGWIIHLNMKRTFSTKPISYWTTFFQFYNKFKKIDWKRDPLHPMSFFGKGEEYDKHYIHAGVIMIDGKYLKLDIFSFWIFKAFCLKNKLKG